MPSRLLRRRDIYHGCFHTMCPSAQQVTALLGCSVTRSDRLRPARFRARFKCSKRTILAVVPAGNRPGKVRGVEWLPTLAGLAGGSHLVPKDRPIDGKDNSASCWAKALRRAGTATCSLASTAS